MKLYKLLILSCILLLLFGCKRSADMLPPEESNRPYLRHQKGNIQLMVEKEPFLILGGQLLNSSASNLNYLDPAWDSLKALNLNTVILPVTWQQFEPVEGEFNYYLIDGLISKAREYKLRLIVLWYGSWKNGMSGYVPEWIISAPEKYPRVQDDEGKTLEIVSCFGKKTKAAELNAFVQFMKHVKEVDEKRNTIIMVQIQDKVGIPDAARDYSSLADIAFQQKVPSELIDYLETNIDKINPGLRDLWKSRNYRKSGSWQTVFGKDERTEEIFMAWHFAKYLNGMAERGKAEYRLPIYVNAFVPKGDICESEYYLSGSPCQVVIDIWKAGAPFIDFYAPVMINKDYKTVYNKYGQDFNPLFVPEACAFWNNDTLSAAAKAFYVIGCRNSIGFAPVGIDHVYSPTHSVRQAYSVLQSISHLIFEAKTNDNIQSFIQEDNITDTCLFEDVRMVIDYQVKKPEGYPGFGLIIKINKNEFIITGNGCNITFESIAPDKPNISLVWVEEGNFVDYEWKTRRVLGGDETVNQGTAGIKLPPDHYNRTISMNKISIQKVKILNH